MNEREVKKLIDIEVNKAVAVQFGVIMEWLKDQFALIHERFESLESKMDRGFAEIRSDLEQVKMNTDRNTLDILALQEAIRKL